MTELVIVMCEGFADWECAHLMAAGRGELGLDIVVASPGGLPVTSIGGLRVSPDMAIEAIDAARSDGVVICGGMIWQRAEAPDIAPLVADFTAAGKPIGAICDGVLALAKTGRLDHVAHTGNNADQFEGLAGYAGIARYRDVDGAVADGGVVTAGGAAPVSFMVEMLAALECPREPLVAYAAFLAAEHGQSAGSGG